MEASKKIFQLWRTRACLLGSLQVFAAAFSVAQEAHNPGIFGAVTSDVTTLRGATAVFAGGEGGWMLGRSFGLGIAGHTLLNDIESRVADTLGNHGLTLSYGGVTFAYVLPLEGPFDAVLGALVGGGSISHNEVPYIDRRQYHDPFLVIEPRVSVEASLSKIFRIAVGASYRQVAWLRSSLATQSELSGVSGNLTLKVGFF